MIQAPSTNLVRAKMTVTTAVQSAPRPLMINFHHQPESVGNRPDESGGPRRAIHQRRAIPACDNVNERKTPTAHSGIRAVTLALKAMMSKAAIAVRVTMPRENTNRLPR